MALAVQVDYLVMGAGVAGLRAAIELADHGSVLVATKESVAESNTHYAQGGIAVAMEGDEDVALHLEDTVEAGDGLVYRPAAEVLVEDGPLRVAELIEWGANFDRDGNRLLRTREAAHSRPRILHANRSSSCAVKGAGPQWVQIPPGNWFAPPGSNRSSSGGNETAEASGVEGR
jgi:L-aspartate oxidase